jgi:hypothetical protein
MQMSLVLPARDLQAAFSVVYLADALSLPTLYSALVMGAAAAVPIARENAAQMAESVDFFMVFLKGIGPSNNFQGQSRIG